MTRQEELNEAWCKYMGKCSTEILHALAFALRWCDEHPNWISVEERLPEENTVVIAYSDLTDLFNEETHLTRTVCYDDDGFDTETKVSHWMQLPAPPEHIADVSKKIGSSEKPNNCKKFGMKGYENVIIHEGNTKGGVL